MLIRHYVVLIFWVWRLVLRWDIDLFMWEMRRSIKFLYDHGRLECGCDQGRTKYFE